MYRWRTLTQDERDQTLRFRQAMKRPWHGPPHRDGAHVDTYLFTAACYEHRPVIGASEARLRTFESDLLKETGANAARVLAWVVLPNHYHVLATVSSVRAVVRVLGRLHGRTSHQWNTEEETRGRQVWCRCAETAMKSDRHLWATVNYIHHNPVKHGLVDAALQWPYSSVHEFLATQGPAPLEALEKEYPVERYGAGWDW